VAFYREIATLTPLNMAPAIRSPTGSWMAAATSRSHMTSPLPDDHHMNGVRVASPAPNGKPSRQDKKRLSLAFLTKGVLMGDSEKDEEDRVDKQSVDDNDASSVATSTQSPGKEVGRNRLSLSFLHTTPATPNSPAPEALPAFSAPSHVSHSNMSQNSLGRSPSQRQRPETSKSVKSGKSEASRKGSSMKKRLSFMNISKKSSKSSVRGSPHDILLEE
jgi:dedicator of cytokinesis protein 3